MEAYREALSAGEEAMRAWMQGRDPKSLPGDVYKAPEDCPLWKMGLSLAQAGSIWAKAKAGGYS